MGEAPATVTMQLTDAEAAFLREHRAAVTGMRPATPPLGYATPADRRGASGLGAPSIGTRTGTFPSSISPTPQAYGPSKESFGPDDVRPAPPIATTDTAPDSLAPWPIVDKWPTTIGAGLSFAYLSATQRTALSGYRQPYVDLLREILERDPHLFATLKKRVLAVAAARFEVTPAVLPDGHPDKARAVEIAQDIERRVRAIPRLHRAIAVLAWAIYYAITGLEIHWKWSQRDGWNVEHLGFIHSRRLQYPDTATWDLYIWDQGMVLWNGGGENAPTASALFGLRVADYPHKFVIHAPQISGDYPTREGLGRMVSEWALSKRLGARTALAYLERFIKPWPMASYNTADPNLEGDKKGGPRIATTTDINKANSALQSIGIGALSSYVHSDAIKVELITPDKQRPKITFDQYNAMCNAEVSKGVLGQTLTTEAGQHGGNGRGLGKVHQDEQRSLFEEDAIETGETLADQLFRPLVLLNHEDAAHLVPGCRIHIEESDPRALMELASLASEHNVPVDADKIAEEVGLATVPNKDGKPRRMFPIADVDPGELDPAMYPAPEENTLAGQRMAQRGAASADKWAAARAAKATKAETGAEPAPAAKPAETKPKPEE
jgi:hypothetical protein